MSNLYTSKDQRFGISDQPVWGTPAADADAVVQLDIEPPTINEDFNTREGLGSHGARHRISDDVLTDRHGSLPVIPMSGDCKKDELAHFLFAHFQNVTEGETTPFDKTFIYPATQPDFVADAGHFMTIFSRKPDASKSFKVGDCIINKLVFTIDPRGMLKISPEWMSRGPVDYTSNPSGTWARTANAVNTDFFHFNGDGTKAGIVRFTINDGSESTIIPSGTITLSLEQTFMASGTGAPSSTVDSFAILNRVGTLSFVAEHGAMTTTIKNARANNTLCTFNLGWGNATPGDDDGDLDITVKGKVTEVDDAHDDILGINCTVELVGSNTDLADYVTIVMADAIDRSW